MVFFEIILQLQIAVLIHGCHIFVPLNRIDVLIALLGNAAQHFLISKLEGRFFQIWHYLLLSWCQLVDFYIIANALFICRSFSFLILGVGQLEINFPHDLLLGLSVSTHGVDLVHGDQVLHHGVAGVTHVARGNISQVEMAFTDILL